MMQNVLMLLAPAHGPMSAPPQSTCPASSRAMATRARSGSPEGLKPALGAALSVAGNALGLILFLAGLGLVLRLAEILLS